MGVSGFAASGVEADLQPILHARAELIFLRYAYSRFKLVEAEILSNRPSRGGRVLPVEASDFAAKSALFLPKEVQYVKDHQSNAFYNAR